MGRRAAGFLLYRKFESEIQYLLLKASYGNKHWTPPKGHVDPGEDDFTTALRETKEEAGYAENDMKIHKDKMKILNYNVNNKPKTVVYWLAELISTKDPTLSEEHTEFKFLPKKEAIELSGYADFAEMVEYFHDEILKL
ncbi:unnamed protein product [Diamesa serratosioi]